MKKIILKHKKRLDSLLLIIAILLFSIESLTAQDSKQIQKNFESLVYPSDNPDWFKFRPDVNISPQMLFPKYNLEFGLTEKDEMRLINQKTDEIGYTHDYYHQYHAGIRIEGSEFLVHSQNGFLKTANGKIAKNLDIQAAFTISENDALAKALNDIKADQYMWQNPEEEKRLKDKNHDHQATYFPKGEKVFVNKIKDDRISENYLSAYAFDIYTSVPFGGWKIFVTATTGEIIRKIPLVADCNNANVTTTFYGNRDIWNTQITSPATFRLIDDCTPTVISVLPPSSSTAYSSTTNTWTGNEIQSAVTSLWGVRRTIDYYDTFHQRNGYDDSGGDIVIHQGATFINSAGQPYYANASFLNGTLNVGWDDNVSTNPPNDDWNTIDIMGHEVTHGVTANNGHGGLDYQGESGALNESFSDIFGKNIEFWASPGTFNWLVASQRGSIRSMSNPNAFLQPDTYGANGTYWVTTTNCNPSSANDQCGVHTNSGVQNLMYSLLVTGGSGTNDNGNAYSVTGIGMLEARTIAYYTLTNNLTSGSNYTDARKAWIQAAEFLYGSCSNEAIQTGNAWYAVGVGTQLSAYSYNICGLLPPINFSINKLSVSDGCSATTSNGIVTSLSSAVEIVFYPGFLATYGSLVTAYIEPCNMTIYKNGNTASNNQVVSNIIETVDKAGQMKDVKILPNPFISAFELSIYSDQQENALVTIYNPLGLKLKEALKHNISKGVNKISFDCSDLSPGVYFIEIYTGDTKTVKRIVKS